LTARITYLPVGAQRDGGRPGVTAGGTSIALADTDSDGFGARGRCARVFSAERMLILTALTTTRVVAAADGLRCAGASDGRVTVTGSYPSGQSNLDVTTCRPSATLRCAALVLLFPTK